MSTEPSEADVHRGKVAYRMGDFHRDDDVVRVILAAVLPLYRDRLLTELADEVRSLAVAGENDGLPWTPGDAGTEAYNEGIHAAYDCLRSKVGGS